MKKILILAYDFPPYSSAGAQRPCSWYKYFHKFGLYPVVVTRHWDEDIRTALDYVKPSTKQNVEKEVTEQGTIIRVPYKANLRDWLVLRFGLERFVIFRKFLSAFFMLLKHLTFFQDNTREIYEEARDYLRENKCDIIIATVDPFILLRYAAALSKEFDIPWIADYRDEWTSDPYYLERVSWLKFYEQNLERKYLKNVELITTVTETVSKRLQGLHHKKPIRVVLNGYDLDIRGKAPVSKKIFQIAYNGQLHPPEPLELFLEGFRDFMEAMSEAKVKLVFYGVDFYVGQKERIFAYDRPLNKHITTTGRLPLHELFQELQNADILLLLATEGLGNIHIKLFEYLSLNRKIIMVKDDKGPMAEILKECHGGVILSLIHI